MLHIATILAGFDVTDIENYQDPNKKKRRHGIDPEVQAVVYARPGADRCSYCGVVFSEKTANLPGTMPGSYRTLDHIVPYSLGGKDVAENLTPACMMCNKVRGNQPLEEFRSSRYLRQRRKGVRCLQAA